MNRIFAALVLHYNNVFGFSKLKQEALLRKALKEEKIQTSKLDIKIDHTNGINYIGSMQLPIIYPKSFFSKASKLTKNIKKNISYYFNGYMPEEGGRRLLMEPFMNLSANIINSQEGRIGRKKAKFNSSYFKELSEAKYGLCPHQMDWKGPRESMWTYRFIECCMVKTIPVIFEKAPLSEAFIEGYTYLLDDIALTGQCEYDSLAANNNYNLVVSQHSLNTHVVNEIKRMMRS